MPKTLTAGEIRTAFLEFFRQRGHQVLPSSPLVPEDDPTLLFTNAGMVQFKDVFTGRRPLPFARATTAQKCVRAGGKHNDLENVGKTARHHTFFEMLGNFSFGDYFKREAIAFAWEFVTGVLELPPSSLWATIFEKDDEAAALWREVAGLPPDRIVRLGEKDNFWAMGETGPCGPCSEILVDRGEGHRCGAPVCGIGACDCDRWLEIWNLVFMQFDRASDGSLAPLPKPSVDTGMGLERVASVMQGVDANWDTDLFRPILDQVARMCGRPYDPGPGGFPFRVVADHARTCTFLVADGVLPGNEGRGYVLRRILRRAARLGRRIGFDGPFLHEIVPTVTGIMGQAYPELVAREAFVRETIRSEEERFGATLAQGMALFDHIVARARAEGRPAISGREAFQLYDTFGFPLDLLADAAEEAGLALDAAGFEAAMGEQRRRAREDWRRRVGSAGRGADWAEGIEPTEFLGYATLAGEAEVLALAVGSEGRMEARSGDEAVVVLNRTPFYAESGGQVGDTGVLAGPSVRARVLDTRKEAGVFLHVVRVDAGRLAVGDVVETRVDAERRRDIARHHSATHLLHRALKDVLGETANQAGSLVGPDRLRFDFTAPAPLDGQGLAEVEARVNRAVLSALPVVTLEVSLAEAKAMGAMALFGEKYGDVVRVVRMGDYSLELCGGTHVSNTSEVGLFRLTSEGGVGSGVRRVEAVAGRAALERVRRDRELLERAASLLKAPVERLPERLDDTLGRLREAESALAAHADRSAQAYAERLAREAEDLAGGRVAFAEIEALDAKVLGSLADQVRARVGTGGAVLAAREDGRVLLLAAFSHDFVGRGAHAGKVVGAAAREVGGGGGGRPDFAQASGRDAGRVHEALEAARRELCRQLGAST